MSEYDICINIAKHVRGIYYIQCTSDYLGVEDIMILQYLQKTYGCFIPDTISFIVFCQFGIFYVWLLKEICCKIWLATFKLINFLCMGFW